MAGLVIDTHALVWFLTGSPRLPSAARKRMEAALAAGDALAVPAICLVEILYLVEKGRLPGAVWERVSDHLDMPDAGLRIAPLDRGVAAAVGRISREEIPDMPDRIIAATALHLGLPLVSRDGRIRRSGSGVERSS